MTVPSGIDEGTENSERTTVPAAGDGDTPRHDRAALVLLGVGITLLVGLMAALTLLIVGAISDGGDTDSDAVSRLAESTSPPDTTETTGTPAATETTATPVTTETAITPDATETTIIDVDDAAVSGIVVFVLDSTGGISSAVDLTEKLAAVGYQTLPPEPWETPLSRSRIWYAEGFEAEGEAILRYVPDAVVEQFLGVTQADLIIVLGASYEG